MLWKKDVLFCDINPTCYAISQQKEICRRHIKNLTGKIRFASLIQKEKLPELVSAHSSGLIKRGKGIDITLQENKAVNIRLACKKLNGIIIRPGEEFSFWKTVGKTTRRKGYKDGRVLVSNKLRPGIGGGLCNLANTINLLVINSPLEVTEFHEHSDALAPDGDKRIPFSSGTSVSYNYIDYRFRNNTDQDFQLLLWCEGEKFFGELRCEKDIPWRYEISEEEHRFVKEGEKYFRRSKIYKNTIEKETNKTIEKKLILDNHSEVMFDYSLIPSDQIKEK